MKVSVPFLSSILERNVLIHNYRIWCTNEFKSQKAILDKAKEQAPELYNSCISMLKAMIELCSLAGLDEGQAEQEVNEIEGQGEAPEEIPGEEGAPKEHACPNCGHQKEAAPEEGSPQAPQS